MASLSPIQGALGAFRARHLLRRATMGPTVNSFIDFENLTVDDAISELLTIEPLPPFPIDPATGNDYVFPNFKHEDTFLDTISNYTNVWWLDLFKNSGNTLQARMLWVYYTHFPMILSRIEGNPNHAINYIRLLHFYALGNYKGLTKALVIDNGMLLHLDGNLNVKGVPQENFAREFLELFTVGKGADQGDGNYTTFTEQDVQSATKVFTGWGTDTTFQTIDPVTGIPTGKVKGNGNNSSQHDVTTKQFSVAFNNTEIVTSNVSGSNTTVASVYQELDEFIDMIFNSEHTAKNICRRLYRQFVYFDITPEIETDIIEPLAALLIANDYEIISVLEVLLKSEHFYDQDNSISTDNNIGAIIKSPLDLVIGTIRLFAIPIADRETALGLHNETYSRVLHLLSLQGLEFFEPYDVAGHDAYFQYPLFQRFWISSNYLANRYKFIHDLIGGYRNQEDVVLMQMDVMQFVLDNCTDPSNATLLVEELVALLLPIELTTDRFNYFRDNVLLDQLSAINWSMEWNNYLTTNDATAVKSQLERLAIGLMESPEYQLY